MVTGVALSQVQELIRENAALRQERTRLYSNSLLWIVASPTCAKSSWSTNCARAPGAGVEPAATY